MTRVQIAARIVDVFQDSYFNAEKERTEVIITFIIQEGAQYTFNGLTITGNEIFTTEKLESFMKLKKGAVFNQAKFQEGISGITNLYYENGYMDNQFYPTVNKNPERKTIAYELVETKVVRDFEQEKTAIIDELKTKTYLQVPSHMVVDNEEVVVSETQGGYIVNVYFWTYSKFLVCGHPIE